MNLIQLRYAVTVADCLNFSHAAEQLHLTQSGISQQILKLENELGFVLFHREKHGISLTGQGARFIEAARPVLMEFESLCALAASLREDTEEYTVQVGVSLIRRPGETEAIADFTLQHPEIKIQVMEIWDSEVAGMLRRGELDVAVFSMDMTHDYFADCLTIPIRDERVMAVMSKAHPFSNLNRLPVENLVGEKLIFAAPQTGTRRMIRAALNRRGLELPESTFLQNVDMRMRYVARNMGITFSMDATLPDPMPDDVTAVLLEPMLMRTYAVAVSPNMRAEHPEAVKLLENFIIELRKKL